MLDSIIIFILDNTGKSVQETAQDIIAADYFISTAIVSAEFTNYTFLGLEPATMYYVGVAARTGAGLGPLVNITVITGICIIFISMFTHGKCFCM